MTRAARYDLMDFPDSEDSRFRKGINFHMYRYLGAHPGHEQGEEGVRFCVWAPWAGKISVTGEFNSWDRSRHYLEPRKNSDGLWEAFIPGAKPGQAYRFCIGDSSGWQPVEENDAFAFSCGPGPAFLSRVWKPGYSWTDDRWMNRRRSTPRTLERPVLIYSLYPEAWCGEERSLSCTDLIEQLVPFLVESGFTHLYLSIPLEQHDPDTPGYPGSAFCLPSSCFGEPENLMYLVNTLHGNGIGVLLDWSVAGRFAGKRGMRLFNGSRLDQSATSEEQDDRTPDPEHFNFTLPEVRSLLMSSIFFWCDIYHVDGFMLPELDSILYLDHHKESGEWRPNIYGGRERLEAVGFLRMMNHSLNEDYPGVLTITEDDSSWPMVTRPGYIGGLGFGLKLNRRWNRETLDYFTREPVFRKYHHDQLNPAVWFTEGGQFLLSPLPGEVPRTEEALLSCMPGRRKEKLATMRLFYGYLYGCPGKKMLAPGSFTGGKKLRQDPSLAHWIRDLNSTLHSQPALHRYDFSEMGFWKLDYRNWEDSVISFLRKADSDDDTLIVIANFTPVPREGYRVGFPYPGFWEEVLNSDAEIYGGSGMGNMGGVQTGEEPYHGFNNSAVLVLPPLGILFLRRRKE